MNEPKPVDEAPPAPAEIRGGDRPADWQPEDDEAAEGVAQAWLFGGDDGDEDSAGEPA